MLKVRQPIMLTEMTKKQEEIGFTLNGIHYYRYKDNYYKHKSENCSEHIRIQKSAFIQARKRFESEVTDNG